MTLGAALLFANTVLVSGQLFYQLDARELTRVGDTYTALGTPPDDWGGTIILTPGAQIKGTFIDHQAFLVRYAPQMLLQIPGAFSTAPAILHHIESTYGVGDAKEIRANAGINFSVGQIDTATSTELLKDFGGFLGPAATGQTSDYLGITATVGLEKTWGRHWRFLTNESVQKLSSSGGSSTGAFDGSTPGPSQTAIAFQEQLSAYSKNELEYKVNPERSMLFYLQLSDVSFPLTTTYMGAMPQVGWLSTYGDGTLFKGKVGAFGYISNPYPGVFSKVQVIPAVELSVDHHFIEQGLPRLHGVFTAGIGPFYDLFFGEVQPRTTLLVELTYDVTHQWLASLSGRFFSAEYYNLHKWVEIPPGRTKEIAIFNLGLKYKYTKNLGFDVGVYADEHWYHASVEQTYPFIRELYFLLGANGTWQVN